MTHQLTEDQSLEARRLLVKASTLIASAREDFQTLGPDALVIHNVRVGRHMIEAFLRLVDGL